MAVKTADVTRECSVGAGSGDVLLPVSLLGNLYTAEVVFSSLGPRSWCVAEGHFSIGSSLQPGLPKC